MVYDMGGSRGGLIAFSPVSISGKVSRDFAELEPENLKIVLAPAGEGIVQTRMNRSQPGAPGWSCPYFPRRPRKAFTLSLQGPPLPGGRDLPASRGTYSK